MLSFIPTDLTPLTLATAPGKQLTFWAKQINEGSGSKSARQNVIKTSCYPKVEDLQAAVAVHCGFDLSLSSISSAGQQEATTAITVDQSIINRQWDDLLVLGREWDEDVKARCIFRLQKHLTDTGLRLGFTRTSELDATLARFAQIRPAGIQPSQITLDDLSLVNQETMNKWITLAELQDLLALSALHGIYRALNPVTVWLFSYTVTGTISDVAHTVNPPQSINLSVINPGLGLTIPPKFNHQDIMLAACNQEIMALDYLNKQSGLRQAIKQVEDGIVKEIQARYGPKDGKRGSADKQVWEKLKGAITRRERVYKVLQEDFLGSTESFFAFVIVPTGTSRKRSAQGKEKEVIESLRSYRKIAEAIPKCIDDLVEERAQPGYTVDGIFQTDLWDKRWGSKNAWEIWRELGKERY
ncbi:hypothetical protein C8J56DRAFT_893431 [Mycena floridula]|nr:hypothetical protein C8J56DRAFT_893431 [Mycena floridula]